MNVHLVYMRLGYACINTSIGCTSNSTIRVSSYSKSFISEKIESNLACLEKINQQQHYTSPENGSVVWEKLARACGIYLDGFHQTEWAQQISAIILNK